MKSQKGSAIFFAIVAVALLFAFGIGFTTLIVRELQLLRGVGNSVIALNAADAGIEHVLYLDIENCPFSNDIDYSDCDVSSTPCYRGCVSECIGSSWNSHCLATSTAEVNLSNASYNLVIIEADTTPDCPSLIGPSTVHYCIESTGSFEDARRTIEVKR